MRWEIKDNTPHIGDIRFKTKFAWLPTVVLSKLTNTDHWIWLELYIEEQEYQRYKSGYTYEWNERWCTVAKTIHI
jgi:hypothetical protein